MSSRARGSALEPLFTRVPDIRVSVDLRVCTGWWSILNWYTSRPLLDDYYLLVHVKLILSPCCLTRTAEYTFMCSEDTIPITVMAVSGTEDNEVSSHSYAWWTHTQIAKIKYFSSFIRSILISLDESTANCCSRICSHIFNSPIHTTDLLKKGKMIRLSFSDSSRLLIWCNESSILSQISSFKCEWILFEAPTFEG